MAIRLYVCTNIIIYIETSLNFQFSIFANASKIAQRLLADSVESEHFRQNTVLSTFILDTLYVSLCFFIPPKCIIFVFIYVIV